MALVGCSKESTFVEPNPPTASIHWVNAVPDTNQQDMRVVDMVSNAGLYDANFRGMTTFYQAIEAGSRRIRVFLSSQNPDTAKIRLVDTTFTYTAGEHYNFIHAGFARGGPPARAVWIVTQPALPTLAAGQIGFRVINAGAGLGNVDIRLVRRATDTLPDAATFAAVPFGPAGSAYLAIPVDADTGQRLRLSITAAGAAKTPALVAVNAQVGDTGVTGDPLNTKIAGSRAAGSVFTAVVVPASVPGSNAPQGGAFAAPSVLYLVDRRP
jgi:hypothetical protein